MASLTHVQTRSVVDNNKYRVTEQITLSTDIPATVFVLRSGTGIFSRVATVSDMFVLGTVPEGDQFYRVSGFQRDFDDVGSAIEFGKHVKLRLKQLVDGYTTSVGNFVGTETETVG